MAIKGLFDWVRDVLLSRPGAVAHSFDRSRLKSDLARFGEAHRLGEINEDLVDRAVAELGVRRPNDESYVGYEAGFYGPAGEVGSKSLLQKFPRLAWIYILHGNGRLREAALKALDEPAPGPFFVFALANRLNDWAPQVRAAAAACAGRVFPKTSLAVVGPVSRELLARRYRWQRWSSEADCLDRLLARPDITASLVDDVVANRIPRPAQVFRQILRQPFADDRLANIISSRAPDPVRAVALAALLNRQVRWHSGFETVWIDKSLGKSRRSRTFVTRPVIHDLDISSLAQRGLADPGAAIRKVALQYVIDADVVLAPQLLHALAADRARPVRDRAEFLLRRGRS